MFLNCLKVFLFSLLCVFCGAFSLSSCIAEEPIEFIVLISSYNNARWYKKNLDSVFCQTYPNWHIHYVDDCSQDGTGKMVDEYISERGFLQKCTVVHNKKNKKAMANYYHAIKKFNPRKIVVNLDGDDWLAHDKVLELLVSVYKDPNVWLTYGTYQSDPPGEGCCSEAVPEIVVRNHSYRKYKWVFSHLRTFYAGLFQKISKKDLLYKNQFVKVATDQAFMLPMVEMASKGHFRFIDQILYIYNCSNPISNFRIAIQEGIKSENFIRSKPPYQPLDRLF